MTTEPEWVRHASGESERLGLTIMRGTFDRPIDNAQRIAEQIQGLDGDLLIIRVPAGDFSLPLALVDKHVRTIHADTLVYYELDTRAAAAGEETHGFAANVDQAKELDRSALFELASRAFSGYRSHYNTDRRLDPNDISAGYGEWATSCISESIATEENPKETWVIRENGTIRGFATCVKSQSGQQVEILLNAVDPAHARKGLYTRLLRHLIAVYRGRGYLAIRVSTQVWNYAVQRAWVKAGFVLSHAFDTYHVHPRST